MHKIYLRFTLVILAVVAVLSSEAQAQSQTFTTSQSFTVPAGVSSLTVQCWGGGGAGGRGGSSNKNGGGGGAGGQFVSRTLAVSPGQVYQVVVGAGGIATATNGNPGGDTYFGANLVLAKGGIGGSAFNGTSGAGGIGSSVGAVGTLIYAGGTGATGSRSASGGGGGGAGSLGAGNAASGTTGGAARANNGGAGGNGTNVNSGNGSSGAIYGAGGGGATRTGAPGSGAQGLVIVSWSCSVSLTSASGTNAQSVCSGTAIVPITYQFSGVTGATVSGLPAGVTGSFNSANNVFTISGTPTVAGTFNYTITPVGGCSTTTATGSITVSSPAVSVGPVLSAICQGGSTPALGGSVSGGASGGTWSDGGVGGAFNPTATNLNATYTPPPGFTGTVTLTLTSSGGCRVVTGSKTLVVNPNPSAAISYQGSPFCNSVTSAAVTLTGTTGGTFSSSPLGLSLNATSGQINPSSSTTGSYTVTYDVTGSGCSFSTITTVVVDAAPQLACSSSNPINCVSSTSVLSSGATAVSGATITSYSWSPGGGTSSSITVSDGINYSVTVTQSNGCTSSCSVSAVMDTCKPTVSVSSSGGGGACSGTPTTLSAAPVVCSSNTVSYSWSNGSTQSAISTSVAGTYSVTVTQNPNGCTASASGTVVASGSPVAVSVSASPIPCFGGTTSVAVSATGGTPPYSGTGSFVITAGTYSYVVTDAVGCTGSAAITVANPAVLNASATVTSTIVCFGGTGTVAVTASGGTAPYSGTGTLAMVAGTRTFTVTDSRGCSATTNSITLTQPTQLLLTTNTTPTNCGAFIGSASAVASGGVSPYSYVWSDGQSGSSAVNLGGGTYVVTVTDAIGCSTTATASIAVNGGTPLGLTGPIIGPAGACLKSTVTYSVDPVSGAGAYTWTLPFGVSGLSSANSITVNFDSTYAGGSICVTPSNTCATGNTSCINIPAITVRPSTPGPVTITGNVCGPDTITVSVAPIPNTTNYVWSVSGTLVNIVGGQGTPTARISVPAGFTNTQLGIQAFNCIGSSSIRFQTVIGRPVVNTSLSGPTTICPNVTQNYSVGTVIGATSYSWSISGNAIIQSSFLNTCVVQTSSNWTGGVLTVTASNSCGSGSRSFNLFKTVPQPGAITGPATNLCIAAGVTSATYSINPVAGALSYVWTVPAGMTITFNGGTYINVDIDPSYTTGSVCVAGVNGCGTGTYRCLFTTQAPPVPTVINGPTNVCKSNSFAVYGVSIVNGAIDYGWFVNNGTGLTPYGSACVLNFLTSTAPSSSLQVNSINECAASQPYRITIYIDATCRQSSTETFSDELIAYPNPASDHATLRFSSGIDDRSTLEVFDRLGSKVYLEEGISVSSGYNSIQLPAGKWAPGIYLVRLYSTSSGERSVRLVIE